jgi:hypothetical protein
MESESVRKLAAELPISMRGLPEFSPWAADAKTPPYFAEQSEGSFTSKMLGNAALGERESTISSASSETNMVDPKPNRKRKRKGLGNWTRTTLACNRCRKMKIRVNNPSCCLMQCDDTRPCTNCKRWSYECVTTQTDASQSKMKYRPKRPQVANSSDSINTQDSLRKRIQRIETLLHGRQQPADPQHSILSALSGIEKLLGIPPPNEPKSTILMPGLIDPSTSPTTLPSPAGSSGSQARTAFLGEANHKRWGAESAIGQSWSKISAMDPRLQTLSNTLGLPGADERPKPAETQPKILASFPDSAYAMQLFDAYCEYVSPIFNIIHPVRSLIKLI